MFVKNGTGILKKVIVSEPLFLKPAPINEIAKKWRDSFLDKEKMMEEHRRFVNEYKKAGVETVFLNPDKERPNSVFARDFGGCIKEGYILGNFKHPLRYKERLDYEKKMSELKIPKVAECREGFFEGGDFAFMNEKWIAIGMADRTDIKGVNEIKRALEPLGYTVTGVLLKKEYLHLDMCFNLVDDELCVAYKKGLPDDFVKMLIKNNIEIISVPEESIFEHGCNLQSLGGKRVFSLKKNGAVNELLSKKNMEIIEIDITEILKAGGGPHCMTFPLSRI